MTAVDSFGTLTADQLIIFPHFGRQFSVVFPSSHSFFKISRSISRAPKNKKKRRKNHETKTHTLKNPYNGHV